MSTCRAPAPRGVPGLWNEEAAGDDELFAPADFDSDLGEWRERLRLVLPSPEHVEAEVTAGGAVVDAGARHVHPRAEVGVERCIGAQ